ncbi:MFS transporter [Saccharopolyspora sp. SCSIO 74807]|uniref:MFS transporter n=1 Tax=Saccharopolyspora sp. SCSIO 74807 TaxID=3118084 RepID=UPI0030D3FB75
MNWGKNNNTNQVTENNCPHAGDGTARRGFAGLPARFWVLFCGQLVNRLGGMVMAFLALYLHDRGLGPAQIGLVLAAHGAGSLVSQPIGGALADRFGRRPTMLIALLSTSAAMTALGIAGSLPALIASATVLGVVAEIYRPAAAALVADVVPVEQRARAYGLLFWAINLGFSAAGMAAGYLATHGYWMLFVIDVVTGLLGALVVAIGLRDEPHRPVRRAEVVGYRTALRDPLLLALTAVTLGFATVYQQWQVTIPLAIRDDGLSTTVYGSLAAMNGVLIVLLQPFLSSWFDRFDRMHVLAVSAAMIGLGMTLTGLAHEPWQFGASTVLWTLGEIGTAGNSAALAADIAPAAARGRYQAVLGWGWGAAALLGSGGGSLLYGAVGPAAVWTCCLVLGSLSAAGSLALRNRVRDRTALSDSGGLPPTLVGSR